MNPIKCGYHISRKSLIQCGKVSHPECGICLGKLRDMPQFLEKCVPVPLSLWQIICGNPVTHGVGSNTQSKSLQRGMPAGHLRYRTGEIEPLSAMQVIPIAFLGLPLICVRQGDGSDGFTVPSIPQCMASCLRDYWCAVNASTRCGFCGAPNREPPSRRWVIRS